MKRDYRVYIDDILEALGKIERYTRGLNFEEFSQDSKTIDAVVRNFEIRGYKIWYKPRVWCCLRVRISSNCA